MKTSHVLFKFHALFKRSCVCFEMMPDIMVKNPYARGLVGKHTVHYVLHTQPKSISIVCC